jgi:outer membrane protein TolC
MLFFSSNLFSQNIIDKVLAEVEKNNKTLAALRNSADAEKLANKTGIYLKNPEVEFNYLWGNPTVIGNRTDISIRQSFDFPLAYSYKSEISNFKNEQVELEYIKQKKAVFFQTRLICIDLLYSNAIITELQKRIKNAQSIAKSYQSKFEAGESNILDYNKSEMSLLSLSNELELKVIEKNTLLSELIRMNGGVFVEFNESQFLVPVIQSDFEQWYLQAEFKNPVLNWLKKEIEISNKQISLNKAMSMPKFQTGFMSEKVIGQNFQGITLGLSLPLWENKNTVKSAKAKSVAIQSVVDDNKQQFYNQLKSLHAKATGLQKNINEYRLSLNKFDNSVFLYKALNKGEISLIDYIFELSIYYGNVSKLLELEKDLNKTFAELNQFM